MISDRDAILEFHYGQSEHETNKRLGELNNGDTKTSVRNQLQRVPTVISKQPVDVCGAIVPKHSTMSPTVDDNPATSLLSADNRQQ